MKLALVSFGSAGDVHPMLALGQALRQRGHQVVVLSLPVFEHEVLGAGLQFEPVGLSSQYEQTVLHPKLWRPLEGLGVLWRYLMRPVLEPTYEALSRLIAGGLDAIVAAPIVMGARIASERWGTPLLTVYTAATMLRSTQWPLTVAAWRVPRWIPGSVTGLMWRTLDRVGLEPLVRADLDTLRRRVGLQPLQSPVFGQWMHSPHGGLALFPPWFAQAGDWPAHVRHAGFMLYGQDALAQLPDHLQSFLDRGPKPVIFLAGTAQHFARHYYSAAIAACRQLGVRGVLLGPAAPAVHEAQLCSAPYVPLEQLLGHALAVVHHGGVGTCAQALRSGVPQAVLPSAYDQFDNAMRLEHLGVGLSLPMKRVSAAGLAGMLARLMEDGSIRYRCMQWAARVDVAQFRLQACLAVEALERHESEPVFLE